MIPAAFRLHAAKTLLKRLLCSPRHNDDAKFLAGGHSLLPLMKLRLPSRRFSSTSAASKTCRYIREARRPGPRRSHHRHRHDRDVRTVDARIPLLPQTASSSAIPQVRTAEPSAAPSPMPIPAATAGGELALSAEISRWGPKGERAIKAVRVFYRAADHGAQTGRDSEGDSFRRRQGRCRAGIYEGPSSGFRICRGWHRRKPDCERKQMRDVQRGNYRRFVQSVSRGWSGARAERRSFRFQIYRRCRRARNRRRATER